MKIGIVTVYKASNYGAFFQAFALQSYLQEKGHQVWFIKHYARKPFLDMLKKIILSILQGRVYKISFWVTQESKMRQSRKLFHEKNRKLIDDLDVIILGSDEIWNVKRRKIYKYPILLGQGITHSNKISYAPSVNASVLEDFKKKPKLISALNELRMISVRDEYSKNIVTHIISKDIHVVLDPTALIPQEFYREHMKSIDIKQPFVLVYSYGNNMNNYDVIEKLVQCVHDKNLVLISVLGYLEWCDYNIGCSPFEVLSYFAAAEFVVTDTFHGTMFSVIFEKDFAITNITSQKLDQLLCLLNVKGRVINEYNEIEKSITTHIDYDLVKQILNKKVQESKKFLNTALKNSAVRR